MNRALQLDFPKIRRIEQHQQTMVNWLNPADQSVLETTIGEQVAIEVTAAPARAEPVPGAGLSFRAARDFDHMYRYSALMDRVDDKDANNLLQSHTDVLPGRPTMLEQRSEVQLTAVGPNFVPFSEEDPEGPSAR